MDTVLQFKITLKNSKPAIWRKFEIADHFTFYDLHLVIQNVMGWMNMHLYQFIYEKHSIIGNPEMLEEEVADDKELKLSELFNAPKIKMIYEYDFGDGWEHQLLLEKIIKNAPAGHQPVCIFGEMNCPPEDCGGMPGFKDLLKVIKDQNHPEHEDMIEWIGEGYEADCFDLTVINDNLKNYKDIDMGFT